MALTLSQVALIEQLQKQLDHYRFKNSIKSGYYLGTTPLRQLDINRPENLRSLKVACSFPSLVVDVIEERINFQGFSGLGTEDMFFDNYLEDESSQIHSDMLLYGTSYVAVGRGNDDEPDILISPQSPNEMIGIRNPRTRKLDVAMNIIYKGNGKEAEGTLYLPFETIAFTVSKTGQIRQDGEANVHGLKQIPVFQFINRAQTSARGGRSEITPAIESHTDAVCRTLADLEINRAFYGNPIKYLLNVNREEFQNPDGSKRDPLNARADSVWVLGQGDNVNTETGSAGVPSVGQFETGNPKEHIALLEGYAFLVAQETGIPLNMFGINTGNPPSAEGIYAQEGRLIKKAERKITSVKRTWVEAATCAVTIRDGKAPSSREIDAVFAKPQTPTQAATTDAIVKLVQAGVYPPHSELTKAGLNLSTREQEIWDREATKAQSVEMLSKLGQARGTRTAEM